LAFTAAPRTNPLWRGTLGICFIFQRRVHLTVLLAAAGFATPAQAATNLQFSVVSMQIQENNREVVLSVVRTGSADGIVSVDYATSDDTAKAGEDYDAVSGSLTFSAGETYRLLSVSLINDGMKELTERFMITLSNPAGGAALGARKSTSIDILDNDQGLTFGTAVFGVSENSLKAVIRVSRGVDDTSKSFTVDYATVDGTAINGEDPRQYLSPFSEIDWSKPKKISRWR